MSAREAVLVEARHWIGTPYRHQASARGAGTDCLGLVRGIWRALYGPEPEAPPAYTPDWAERCGEETLLEAAHRYLEAVDATSAAPGDVLLFRMRTGAPVKHCAILSGPDRMIHAWQGRSVRESSLCPWWRRRLAAVAAFPPLTKE